MEDHLHNLVESLREELKEYSAMLNLLDQQQQMVIHRQTQDLLQCVSKLNSQVEILAAAREEREQRQRHIARLLGLPEETTFALLTPCLPGEYQPLVKALVAENNELLQRIHRRARHNHLLFTRITDLMQRLLDPFFPGSQSKTYNDNGRAMTAGLPQRSIYEAIG
ncbi:MAG TPA: flagellar protein FlgN [Candidatus Saccharimonadales bacterium]|nr:flagellar protein FlgN [Candidatus Saccharimonadales bacterium]